VKASPKTIWRVPVYLPYLQLDLTDEAISAAERKIGYTLPQSFIALLREQNGGYIRYSLEDLPHEQIYGIGSSFPLTHRFRLGGRSGVCRFSVGRLGSL